MDNIIIVFSLLTLAVTICFLVNESRKVARLNEENWKNLWSSLIKSHGFRYAQKVFNTDRNMALAIDEERICLVIQKSCDSLFFRGGFAIKVLLIYPCDLLSAELFEDGNTVTKTPRMNQAGNALLGGLILGPAGALVGSLTSKTITSKGNVKRIDLRLIINDTKRPIYDINFLDSETDKDSYSYINAEKLSRHWHGVMEVLIRKADSERKNSVPNNLTNTKEPKTILNSELFSVASELEKLNSLRERGILSVEEYQQQKSKLLSSS